MRLALHITALMALAGTAGCAPVEPGPDIATRAHVAPGAVYMGVDTRLLDGDLVNFRVEMKGARDRDDVARYARCAAAQYALIRGYGFARHVRTNVEQAGSLWRGDAVYTVSAALPDGVQQIDAEVVVDSCARDGIPTV